MLISPEVHIEISVVYFCCKCDTVQETREGKALTNWERQLRAHARQMDALASKTGKSHSSLLMNRTSEHRFKQEERYEQILNMLNLLLVSYGSTASIICQKCHQFIFCSLSLIKRSKTAAFQNDN